MKDFLKKIKLIDHLSLELNIERAPFVRSLQANIDHSSLGLFSAPGIFSRSKNEFMGTVHHSGFKLKRKNRLFDREKNFAKATGTFIQKKDRLLIQSEINGFNGRMILTYAIILIFYSLFVGGLLISDQFDTLNVLFIALVAIFMFGLPYFVMRRSVSKLRHELEREFYYLTKQ